MSGATPCGSPAAVLPVTRRKLLILIPARSTPLGASSAAIWRSIQPSLGRAQQSLRPPGLCLAEPTPQSTVFTAHHPSVRARFASRTEFPSCRVETAGPGCSKPHREDTMSHSLYNADRATHLKIVVTSLACATVMAAVGIFAHVSAADLGAAHAINA